MFNALFPNLNSVFHFFHSYPILCLKCHLILNLGCLYLIVNEPSPKHQPPLGRQEAPAPSAWHSEAACWPYQRARLQHCSSAVSQGGKCQPEVMQVLLGQFRSPRLLFLPSAALVPPPPWLFNLLLVSFSLRKGPVGCQSVTHAAAAFWDLNNNILKSQRECLKIILNSS